jgi:hypothetical protein
MAWSPRKLGGNKTPSATFLENKAKGGDELQLPISIVEGTSIEIVTNTQVIVKGVATQKFIPYVFAFIVILKTI